MLGLTAKAAQSGSKEYAMEELTPSGRELEILKVLWELGHGSVRDVHRRMCPHRELAFNTVQTLLRIMDDKGLVSHRRQGRTFVYTPLYSRRRAASRFLKQVFDGALDQVVVTLLSTADPSPEELKQLGKIISQARRRKQRTPESAE
jgi:BlaI family transcriptional regulator, penicillinase repressor